MRGHPRILSVVVPVDGHLEVDHLQMPVRPEEKIVGVDVAVQDARLVKGLRQHEDVRREPVRLRIRHAAHEQVRQRRPVYLLGHDERPTSVIRRPDRQRFRHHKRRDGAETRRKAELVADRPRARGGTLHDGVTSLELSLEEHVIDVLVLEDHAAAGKPHVRAHAVDDAPPSGFGGDVEANVVGHAALPLLRRVAGQEKYVARELLHARRPVDTVLAPRPLAVARLEVVHQLVGDVVLFVTRPARAVAGIQVAHHDQEERAPAALAHLERPVQRLLPAVEGRIRLRRAPRKGKFPFPEDLNVLLLSEVFENPRLDATRLLPENEEMKLARLAAHSLPSFMRSTYRRSSSASPPSDTITSVRSPLSSTGPRHTPS